MFDPPPWRGLYAILDLPHAGGLEPEVAAQGLVAEGRGSRIVQLRAKHASSVERIALARQVRPILQEAGALLIIDDDCDAALTSGADGVHLGQGDMARLAGAAPWSEALAGLRRRASSRPDLSTGSRPDLSTGSRPEFLIGLSTHNHEQVLSSAGLDLDYIGFGPVFPTRSKANPEPCVGLEGLRRACEISSHPVVAIGGIGASEAPECVRVGATAVAMIGGLIGRRAIEVFERASTLAEVLRRALEEQDRPSGR